MANKRGEDEVMGRDGARWYIVTIYWNAERPGLTIPTEYLNESGTGSGSGK